MCDGGIGSHLVFCFLCVSHVSHCFVICWISCFMVGQYQKVFARFYDFSAPPRNSWSWLRRFFICFFGIIRALLLRSIVSPHSVSCMERFSHTGEHFLTGLELGMSFGLLMVLMDFKRSVYSSSLFACVISFSVVRSSVSSPEALTTLIDPCVGCGLSLTDVYLSINGGGVVSFFDGSLLSGSANALSPALMCCTFILNVVNVCKSLISLLLVTSVRSLFSIFVSALWSVWQIISCLAPFKKKWFLLRAQSRALSSSSKIE